jgi:hypothetical protein
MQGLPPEQEVRLDIVEAFLGGGEATRASRFERLQN